MKTLNRPSPGPAGAAAGLKTFVFVLAAVWILAGGAPASAEPPEFVLPLGCEPGKDCWLVNYVDHDPSEKVLDYACGMATYNAPPGNRHKGTDIAIPGWPALSQGVKVMAAAGGVVLGVRDGMADINIREAGGPGSVKGKECGNGVVVEHPDGWTTQYCHMRRGSVAVGKGDRVTAGQVIGMVGHSGLTAFPHLHFQVKKDNKIVDPFVGLNPKTICETGESQLWKKEVLAKLPYRPTAPYIAGFAGNIPKPREARRGRLYAETLPPESKALIFWADIFQVRKGDRLTITVTGPGGGEIVRHSEVLKKNQARRFVYAGKPLKAPQWRPGVYRGEAVVIREKGHRGPERFSIARTLTIPGPAVAMAKPLQTDPKEEAGLEEAGLEEIKEEKTAARVPAPKEGDDATGLTWLVLSIGLAAILIIWNINESVVQRRKNRTIAMLNKQQQAAAAAENNDAASPAG
ncbi:MAG: M23 family metallopeptidase [Rhodospirillales bacterium]